MMEQADQPIILYTSNYCGHSLAVERLLEEHEIAVTLINIDKDPGARRQLVEINGGFASVPTLLFPDGTKMTEPPLRLLRDRLNIEDEGLGGRLRNFFRGSGE